MLQGKKMRSISARHTPPAYTEEFGSVLSSRWSKHWYKLTTLPRRFWVLESNCRWLFTVWTDKIKWQAHCVVRTSSSLSSRDWRRIYCWVVEISTERVPGLARVYRPRAKVPSSYHAPSWSWASIDGPVYPCEITTGSTYLIDILDTEVSNSKIGPLGQVYSGFIVVKGFLIETIYHTLDRGNSACILEANGHNLSTFVYGDTSDTHLEGGTLVHCLALKSYPTSYGGFSYNFALMGLVLQRESETTSEFSRIGHFHMNGVDAIERFRIHISSENTPLPTDSIVESSVIKIIWEGLQYLIVFLWRVATSHTMTI